MGNLGVTEILLIVVVIVLLFGGRKIPELMRGIGQGMKEFRDAQKDDSEKQTTKDKPEEK
jgi:sec-independent protein translocase protein TatA